MIEDAARAPKDLVDQARHKVTPSRPLVAAFIGIWTGLLLAYITRTHGIAWGIAAALVAGALLYANTTWTAARLRIRHNYRKTMTKAGWCWYCHGPHAGRHCPERGRR